MLITDSIDLHQPQQSSQDPTKALKTYLQKSILPPPHRRLHRHGCIDWLSRLGQPDSQSPITDHFEEEPRKARKVWEAYSEMIRRTCRMPTSWTPPREPRDEAASFWFERYKPTDARAGDYAKRYRSAYVWQFGLGALAICFGAAALVFNLIHLALSEGAFLLGLVEFLGFAAATFEFLALGSIVGLVILSIRRNWHERSIEYRLLAELYRKQQVLTSLGWALPIVSTQHLSTSEQPEQDPAAWVPWLFAAELRAAPLPQGNLADMVHDAPRSTPLNELITEQLEYHDHRSEMATAVSQTLERWGERLFVVVLCCVVAKIVMECVSASAWAVPLGFLATVLPALSAAFFGLRAYAELRLLSDQSTHMVAELKQVQQKVARLEMTRPLVSQDLGAVAAALTALMLQDLEGWARRVKGIELS